MILCVFLYFKCILSQMVNFHWKCLLGISFIPWCLHKKKWIRDWNYGTFLQYGQLVGGLFLNSSGIEMEDTLGWTFCTVKIPVFKQPWLTTFHSQPCLWRSQTFFYSTFPFPPIGGLYLFRLEPWAHYLLALCSWVTRITFILPCWRLIKKNFFLL